MSLLVNKFQIHKWNLYLCIYIHFSNPASSHTKCSNVFRRTFSKMSLQVKRMKTCNESGALRMYYAEPSQRCKQYSMMEHICILYQSLFRILAFSYKYSNSCYNCNWPLWLILDQNFTPSMKRSFHDTRVAIKRGKLWEWYFLSTEHTLPMS